MTQTRGRKEVLALRGASGRGRGVRLAIDEKMLLAIWESKGNVAPKELVEDAIDLAAQQDFEEVTGLAILEPGQELERIVIEIERASGKLRVLLVELKRNKGGEMHLGKWMNQYIGILAEMNSNYPEALLEEMLAMLANVRERHYVQVSPAGHWHSFIVELAKIFKGHREKVAAADSSIFVEFLKEIDRQFPGLAFPPSTDGTEGRRDYVRNALRLR